MVLEWVDLSIVCVYLVVILPSLTPWGNAPDPKRPSPSSPCPHRETQHDNAHTLQDEPGAQPSEALFLRCSHQALIRMQMSF